MAESRNGAERAEPASDGGCGPVPVHSLPRGGPAAEAVLMDGMLWMTADSISALLGIGASAVSQHLSDIFSEGELDEGSAVSFPDGAGTGGRGLGTRFYSLDAVISVGWRADSERAADFRTWATRILKELVVKGFALDDERLERSLSDGDRSRDLLERMRSIRASDRRIWQKITDVFAECSANYDRDSPTARRFYGTVWSRFRNAIAGTAAAEGGAEGCLTEEQIRRLEREAPGFFDYIEGLFGRGMEFTMDMFADSACRFLESGDYRTLDGGWGAPGPGSRVKAGPGCGTLDGGEGCASELCMRVGELAERRSAHVRPAAPP